MLASVPRYSIGDFSLFFPPFFHCSVAFTCLHRVQGNLFSQITFPRSRSSQPNSARIEQTRVSIVSFISISRVISRVFRKLIRRFLTSVTVHHLSHLFNKLTKRRNTYSENESWIKYRRERYTQRWKRVFMGRESANSERISRLSASHSAALATYLLANKGGTSS